MAEKQRFMILIYLYTCDLHCYDERKKILKIGDQCLGYLVLKVSVIEKLIKEELLISQLIVIDVEKITSIKISQSSR